MQVIAAAFDCSNLSMFNFKLYLMAFFYWEGYSENHLQICYLHENLQRLLNTLLTRAQ